MLHSIVIFRYMSNQGHLGEKLLLIAGQLNEDKELELAKMVTRGVGDDTVRGGITAQAPILSQLSLTSFLTSDMPSVAFTLSLTSLHNASAGGGSGAGIVRGATRVGKGNTPTHIFSYTHSIPTHLLLFTSYLPRTAAISYSRPARPVMTALY